MILLAVEFSLWIFKMTLNSLFDDYVSFYELILREHTLKSDIYTYNKHIKNTIYKNRVILWGMGQSPINTNAKSVKKA